MNYNNLEQQDFDIIERVYIESETKEKAYEELSDKYDVSQRTIRGWLLRMGLTNQTSNNIKDNIMIYDIETSRSVAKVWWTGKQYVSPNQILEDPKIITISWKWLGENKVHHLTWDKNHCDKKMVEEFGKEYVKANLVIGQNNDRFDNRWVNARLAKFGFPTNNFIRSYDIMKQAKRVFKLQSYSMKYMCQYFNVEQKLEHEGIKMWDMIESGTPTEQKEYLQKMIDYNIGDIISTEALYYRLRSYFGHKIHLGIMKGEEKFTCPDTGSYNVKLFKTTWTPAGTIQRVMISNETNVQYKITNKQYMNFLEHLMKNNGQ